MSTQQVNRGVNVYITSGEADKAVAKLEQKFADLEDKIKKATDPKIISGLNTELAKTSEQLDRAKKKAAGELQPTLRELAATVKSLNNDLKNLSASDAAYEKKVLQLRQANLAYKQQKEYIAGLNQEHNSLIGKVGEFTKELLAPVAAITAVGTLAESVIEFTKAAQEEFEQAEREAARFANTLEAAGESEAMPRLERKIQALADQFTFLDNDEIKGVFSTLITYGKLTEQQIDKILPLIVDLYSKQRLAGDETASLANATELVIKALEGNSKGLKVYGINIKDAGNQTDRFNAVINQLGPKLSGAAKTFGETLPGEIQKTTQEIKDLEEEIGGPLTELSSKFKIIFLNGLAGIIKGFREIKDNVKEIFMSRQELLANERQKQWKAFFEDAEKNANSVVSDASNKSIEEQKRLLTSYGAILKAQRENYDQLQKNGKLIGTQEGSKAIKETYETAKIVLGLNEQIKRIQSGKTLGIDSGTDSVKDKKTAKDFNLDDDKQRLLDRIQKVLADNSDIFTKKIIEINLQLDDLLRGAKKKLDAYLEDENTTQAQRTAAQKKFAQLSSEIEQQRLAEIQQQLLEADKQTEEAFSNRNKRILDDQRRMDQARLDSYLKVQEQIIADLEKSAKAELGETKAADELRVFKARGRAKIDAQIQQLKDQEAIELAAEDAVGSKRLLIIAEYDKKISDLKRESTIDTINRAAEFISTVNTQLNQYYSVINARAQAEIENDKTVNEAKKKQFQDQLNSKTITRQEYDRKVSEMDAQVAKKERDLRIKQFRQQQLTSIAQATVNVAEAVTKMLTAGPVSGQILAGITAAFGLAEIAIIAKQKPPTYARGGFIPRGASHSQGGIKLVDSNSGRIQGEIEGGEPILSRETYRNNKQIVDHLLNSSMQRGGAPISPTWRNSAIPYMNFPAIQQGINRKWASGGLLPEAGSAAQAQNMELQAQTARALERLNDQLESGIRAYTVLTEHNTQQARLDKIQADATGR